MSSGNRSDQATDGSGLLLLFGMPRSGTTWIAKVLDSHPQVDYRHEPDTEWPLTDVPLLIEPEESSRYHKRMQSFLGQAMSSHTLRTSGKTPLFAKQWRGALLTRLLQLNILAAKLFSRAGMALPLTLAGWPKPSAAQTVWKSIESLGRLPCLLETLPDARAIILLRHPCGHIASILRGEKKGSFSSATRVYQDEGILGILSASSLGRAAGLTINGLKAMQPEEVLAWRWRIMNDHALTALAENDRVLVVNYDAFCDDPPSSSRNLLQFAGLEMNPQTQAFVSPHSGATSDAYYSVNKDPAVSANKWRQQLEQDVIDRILAITNDSLAGAYFREPA